MLGWIWSFLAVWEAFSAPMGRWGTYAFPLVGTNREVYVIDGQRVWRLELGSWQEVARLPEEIRAGVIWKGDTLLLGGLNGIYWGPLTQLQRLPLPGTGWAYRFWRSEQGALLRSASGCTWLSFKEGQLSAEPLAGTCMGVTSRGGLFGRQDSLYTWPEGQPLLPLRSHWSDILQLRDQLYGLNERGEVYALSQPNAALATGRAWVGTYLLTERNLLTWPDRTPLLRGDFPLSSASTDPAGELVVALTATEALFIYPRAPLRWVAQWPSPATQAKAVGKQWVAWQGETAFFAGGARRYAATLIEATLYQGRWLWATPRGLLWEDGTPWGEVGRYVSTVAAQGPRLAWAVGLEAFVQEGQQRQRFRFSGPVRRLAWEGKNLWVWQKKYLYRYNGTQWQTFTLPFEAQEGAFWSDSWYFQVGGRWIRVTLGSPRDTLVSPPWIGALPPLPFAWGRPLWRIHQRDSILILTTRGLLVYSPRTGQFPPILWSAKLQGPALRQTEGGHFTLPVERPYIELTWQAQVPFLPKLLEVWAQIGDAPPRRLEQPTLLLALSRPGRTTIRLWVKHPWCPTPKPLIWEIEVRPPWYDTWAARLAIGALLLLLLAGVGALREWNLRQVQRRLTAEREQLLRQTQSQQSQLLQAERMANLGLMAAHIAHEINTPLGVIRSALTEITEAQTQLCPPYPLPAEPRPTSVRLRELRRAWQETHPDLSPIQHQELASLGYTPDQRPLLEPLLFDPKAWAAWRAWLSLTFAAQRALEAADKLLGRVQTIRTYVRHVEELPDTPIALQESLQATLQFYQPLMRQLQLLVKLPPEPLYVLASPARLEQVWANLLQNAIQATPPGGEIRISLQASEGYAEVLFQDSGKGIPPAHWQAIFEPLFTTKAPGEGTGLGLPLCRQIVESYGGDLQLLHSEPGFTLFRVRLPLTNPAEKASAPSERTSAATDQ